jgi:hypothetical protein
MDMIEVPSIVFGDEHDRARVGGNQSRCGPEMRRIRVRNPFAFFRNNP